MSSGAAWRRTSPLVQPHRDIQVCSSFLPGFTTSAIRRCNCMNLSTRKRSSLPTWGDAEVSTSRLGIRILAVFIGPNALELDLIFVRQSDNKRVPWPMQPVVQMPTAQWLHSVCRAWLQSLPQPMTMRVDCSAGTHCESCTGIARRAVPGAAQRRAPPHVFGRRTVATGKPCSAPVGCVEGAAAPGCRRRLRHPPSAAGAGTGR